MSDIDRIKEQISLFPATFGLRQFPGHVFRISLSSSYISEGNIMLYTEIQKGESWLSFCKGTQAELSKEVVILLDSSAKDIPEIFVDKDYGGVFEAMLRGWVREAAVEGHKFKYAKIVLTAGPYRANAVSVNEMAPDTVNVDFYSALRRGFGQLTEEDVAGIKAML